MNDERRLLVRQVAKADLMVYRGAMLLVVAALCAAGAVALAHASPFGAAMTVVLMLLVGVGGTSLTRSGIAERRRARGQLRQLPSARLVTR